MALVLEAKGAGALNFGARPAEPFPFVDHEAAHPNHLGPLHVLLLDLAVGPLVRHLLPAAGDEVQTTIKSRKDLEIEAAMERMRVAYHKAEAKGQLETIQCVDGNLIEVANMFLRDDAAQYECSKMDGFPLQIFPKF